MTKLCFSCKDGVREHARNHEQQEQITEAYFTAVANQSVQCDDTCAYQDKEKHYHCNWVSYLFHHPAQPSMFCKTLTRYVSTVNIERVCILYYTMVVMFP